MDNDIQGTPVVVPRPMWLTILSWFLAVTGMMNLCLLPVTLTNPMTSSMVTIAGAPRWLWIAPAVLSAVINGAAGVAMLLRRVWGRVLYLIGTPLLSIASWAINGFQLGGIGLMGLVFYCAIGLLLLRRECSAYFENDPSMMPVARTAAGGATIPPVSVGRRIGSTVLLIPAYLFLSSGSLFLGMISEMGAGALVIVGIMVAISAVFIVPALYLWGWSRSAMVLGVLFVAVGLGSLMMGVVLRQITADPMFAKQAAIMDPHQVAQMVRGCTLSGIICTLLGAALIGIQKATDWRNSQPESS